MKRIFLLLSVLVLFQMTTVYAQTIEDYVLEHRGDTLVVKDDNDYGKPNALYLLMRDDTVNVPAGRVYMLHKNGYYSLKNNPTVAKGKKTVIAGEYIGLLKTYKGTDVPPIVCGAYWSDSSTAGGMKVNEGAELTVKNVSIELGNSDGYLGWNWFVGNSGMKVTVDNIMAEHTLWTQFVLPYNAKIFIKNSYFVNLLGYSCRRTGGVIDFFSPVDTIMVENSTHIMASGMLYKVRNNFVNRLIYNHNTFINCAGLIFMDQGFQKNLSVTNNIFVNCQVQGSSGDPNFDPGECDLEPGTPIGLINVANIDSSGYDPADIHIYVSNNVIYWDPKFNDLVSYWNANKVSGYDTWLSQMITMNQRTQGYFNDDAKFPYLNEHMWICKLPAFTDPKDLLTTQRDKIYEYAKAKTDINNTDVLESWRLVNVPYDEKFVYADFPIPVDLSYNDADLLKAAWGFPVGDLNWFPSAYTGWVKARAEEYGYIDMVLKDGHGYVIAVENVAGPANKFKLSQNYPNPFNPTTKINFSLPKDGFVTLKVYNAVGQEVAVLLNGFRKAQTYNIEFDASKLTSGVYIYKLQYDNNTISKKMLLMK